MDSPRSRDLNITLSKGNSLRLSFPPSKEELEKLKIYDSSDFPPIYKRQLEDRIFVNRDIRLDRIQAIGFDMDYTLAIYNSSNYEALTYNLLVNQLVVMGYPEGIRNLQYDPEFAIRGLLIHIETGNILKIDMFGNIILAVHGRKKLAKSIVSEIYPSMFVATEDIGKKFYPISTLFNLPEVCLYADLVAFLENNPIKSNIKYSFSYVNLFNDVRTAMDVVHLQGTLKKKTLDDLDRYILKTSKLSLLLDRIRKAGKTSFLITNSDYHYTDKVLSFILNDTMEEYKSWRDFFDIIIVDAKKPTFFAQGIALREVDIATGNLSLSTVDRFEKGKVYQGGSLRIFENYTKIRGNQVLFVGDHIYADIIKSKKRHAWRNLLIVPELGHELKVWNSTSKFYSHISTLQVIKAEIFRGYNSESITPPDISELRRQMKAAQEELDQKYNKYFGSLFRSGSKQSHFAMNVERYADLYTASVLQLLNYPLFYSFTATTRGLPHESSESMTSTV